jgi:hypothetical protein
VQLFAWLPAYRILLVATHDVVVMLMHASLSASTLIFAHPGLSDAQELVGVLTWAALLWVVAGVVLIATERHRAQPSLKHTERLEGWASLRVRSDS